MSNTSNIEKFLEGVSELISNPDLRGNYLRDIMYIKWFEKMYKIKEFLESIPSMNSELFTHENYAMNNSIQIDSYHLFNTHTLELDPEFEFVGWAYADKLRVHFKKDTIALMITHKKEGFDCWFHFYVSEYQDFQDRMERIKIHTFEEVE